MDWGKVLVSLRAAPFVAAAKCLRLDRAATSRRIA
jgi:hypothetical protein